MSEALTLVPLSSLPRVAYLANRLSLEECSPIVALPSSSLVLRYPSRRWEGVRFCAPEDVTSLPRSLATERKATFVERMGRAQSLLP